MHTIYIYMSVFLHTCYITQTDRQTEARRQTEAERGAGREARPATPCPSQSRERREWSPASRRLSEGRSTRRRRRRRRRRTSAKRRRMGKGRRPRELGVGQ
jgi:hypothetical protein